MAPLVRADVLSGRYSLHSYPPTGKYYRLFLAVSVTDIVLRMEYDVYGSLQIVPELWMDRDLEARVLPHDRAEFPLNILERWILGFAIEMGVDGLFQLVVFFPCFHWFVWTRCLWIGPRSRHTTLSKCIGENLVSPDVRQLQPPQFRQLFRLRQTSPDRPRVRRDCSGRIDLVQPR